MFCSMRRFLKNFPQQMFPLIAIWIKRISPASVSASNSDYERASATYTVKYYLFSLYKGLIFEIQLKKKKSNTQCLITAGKLWKWGSSAPLWPQNHFPKTTPVEVTQGKESLVLTQTIQPQKLSKVLTYSAYRVI